MTLVKVVRGLYRNESGSVTVSQTVRSKEWVVRWKNLWGGYEQRTFVKLADARRWLAANTTT